jgi:anti-sigma factor RsiW
MSCKKYKILLSEYIEGTLSDSEKLNLESHLKKCARCKKELELLQNYKKFLSSFEKREAPESIRDNVWKSISEDSTEKKKERKKNKTREIACHAGWCRWPIVILLDIAGNNDIWCI